MEQLYTEDEIKGNIIEKIVFSDDNCVLHFTDERFCIITCSGYEVRYLEIDDNKLRFNMSDKYNVDRLYEFGFMNRDKYDQLRAAFKDKEEAQKEEQERKLFEQLKSKYGS